MTSAQLALEKVGKAVLYGQEARINWAFQKEQREEVANHVHVFVGDLSSGGWCVGGAAREGRGEAACPAAHARSAPLARLLARMHPTPSHHTPTSRHPRHPSLPPPTRARTLRRRH